MHTFKEQVTQAKKNLKSILPATPLQRNVHLSQQYGADIYLKREDLTPVRSYKLRGAFNFISKALANHEGVEKPHFVCASAGNHAQGFAFSCAHFGVHGTIFMPVTTPKQKIDKTKTFGGEFVEVRLTGDIFDQCYAAAQDFCTAQSAHLVPPFDHADIIEGQATIGLEILEQLHNEAPDMIILPVGGGGLGAGLLQLLGTLAPETRFVFVEPEGAPSLKRSLETQTRVKLDKIDNFVDGAAVAQIGALNFDILKDVPSDAVHLVPENRLCATISSLLNIEGLVLEPAGALSIDVLADLPATEIAGKRIVCIVSGGNFDFERLPEVKEKAMSYRGLKKYFILRLPQRPGALKDFLNMLGPNDDIARFEYLKKSARNFGTVLLGIETDDPANFQILFDKMVAGGFSYQDITENDLLSSLIV
ncbi:threonine ammonia-lyase [Maritalea myrionectae]|uniref:L-threonine dehydratase n=1 Tax=Maritalea myrionectae TaxID=454601 RepID=A0A2R4MHD2_9HYPH|nr:threonine ammonia-lyase [Maritalea myrionectae]AVX05448.1 threonine ammonia-lyase [Maritalea myrionectae]